MKLLRAICLLAVSSLAIAACGHHDVNTVDGNDLRPDGDRDADLDGIKDDVDNCPNATNAGQGNEDGDKFGDACDPCPPIADDNPPDGDGDGVGDACDPLPIMFGDTVKFFEGYHTGVPQGWEKAGTWNVAGDQLISSTNGFMALSVTDRTRETVSASISVVSVSGAASEIGVLDNRLLGSSSSVACVLTGGAQVAVYDTNDVAGAAKSAYELTAGQTYLLKLRRDNSTYTCTAVRGTATASATKTITLNNTPYLSGLLLNGAGIRVNWFMVIESL